MPTPEHRRLHYGTSTTCLSSGALSLTPRGGGERGATYQELGGAQHVQRERLDPGVVDPQLTVDPRALDAHQDAQVGGQPGGVWERRRQTEKERKKR